MKKFVYFCKNIETGKSFIFTSAAYLPEGITINGPEGKCIIEDSCAEAEALYFSPFKTVVNTYEKARGASL